MKSVQIFNRVLSFNPRARIAWGFVLDRAAAILVRMFVAMGYFLGGVGMSSQFLPYAQGEWWVVCMAVTISVLLLAFIYEFSTEVLIRP